MAANNNLRPDQKLAPVKKGTTSRGGAREGAGRPVLDKSMAEESRKALVEKAKALQLETGQSVEDILLYYCFEFGDPKIQMQALRLYYWNLWKGETPDSRKMKTKQELLEVPAEAEIVNEGGLKSVKLPELKKVI